MTVTDYFYSAHSSGAASNSASSQSRSHVNADYWCNVRSAVGKVNIFHWGKKKKIVVKLCSNSINLAHSCGNILPCWINADEFWWFCSGSCIMWDLCVKEALGRWERYLSSGTSSPDNRRLKHE